VLSRWIGQELVGNRELKILDEDGKDAANEPFNEILERKACQTRAREGNRLQHAAGSAVLCNPPSPPGGAGPTSAAKLQWSDLPG
jgi:hypothetical protein